MKRIITAATVTGALGLAACAATYVAPNTIDQVAITHVDGTKPAILAAARRALVEDGYQITSFDDASGVISTAPRNLRVRPDVADCGKTMGLDYLLDNRTSTQVGIGVIVGTGQVEVKATIQGEYKPGDVSQNITLTCVSRGVIEQEMLDKIKADL